MEAISMSFKEAFKSFPLIELERLRLRSMHLNDAERYLGWFSAKEVQQFLSGLACPKDIEEASRFIENMNGRYFKSKLTICWGIALKESDELVGRIELCRFVRQSMAEVAYSISQEHWNKGYMTEALQGTVKFGFQKMGLHRIQATVVPENIASVKALCKAGFSQEGLFRQYNYGNEFRDTLMMSILKDDMPV
jgi:ribosomal-protein-alanine N-acetyltransferase